MSKFLDVLLDVFFPTRCILCRRMQSPGHPGICPKCQEELPLASGRRFRVANASTCIAAVYYEDPVRQLIHRYKFSGKTAYAYAFGELVAERIYEDLDRDYDLITWVPLSADRKRSRGYDQAYMIANYAAKRLLRPLESTLKKRRRVPQQSLTKSAEERRGNIHGAYSVPDPSIVRGKRILLIDDVTTTGATLSECAKTLRLAGAKEVMCATLAKTR